ncbi:SAM-dependent methyltransferase [Catenulispora sp. NF23]|uniref:SAM-dependent methyltransferase n=1 Tax=Catenulispora pinistramenti TaxID=2705254 RepID=A0ABS5KMY8_9ACTN|nr:SAM-dependent methyltransferase [Catenulispora pinistramenti]MBS2531924.1 SAM-dependent methyltransferase [Catenulispora pinistramenti]MBS2547403.1 SAM-dependent methyltransferase [Catenulispora pinistramenti]
MSPAAGTPWSDPVATDSASGGGADAGSRIDTSKPHPARIYDYFIGGKQNFPADRAVAEQLVETMPVLPVLARANRAFLGRAVRYAAQQGVKQFLDIGAGLPAAGNTHEVVQSVHPDATVVYVDNDPLVTVHGRALLADEARTRVFEADLRDPKSILSHPDVTALIDFDQPVALLMVAVLHFITDDADPAGLVAALTENLVPGSHLVISHAGSDLLPEDLEGMEAYQQASEGALRDHAQISGFFDGFDLVDPGLVRLPEWRPTEELPTDIDRYWMYGAVGRKR